MPYVMRGRNESAVYHEHQIDLRHLDTFLRAHNESRPHARADVFHAFTYVSTRAFQHFSNVNRFVAGGRIYQRDVVDISYSVKQELQTGSPLGVVKQRVPEGTSFEEFVVAMNTFTKAFRFGGPQYTEREEALTLRFPGVVRRGLLGLVFLGNRLGLLPRSFIDRDPLFGTVFFANLGSIGMDACYHHLYEYGTIGIFGVMGRPRNAPGSPATGPERRRVMTVRWTFDERCEDGLGAGRVMKWIRDGLEDPTQRLLS